jgi:uroporphyrinogen-III synthase
MTHVLVTRPIEAAQPLADQLGALGMSAVVMPFYTFAARQPDIDLGALWSAEKARKLAVFTSPRAVQYGLPFMPGKNMLDDLEIAVVGSATRASLEASGYPVHVQARSGFTSEDLLLVAGLAENPGVAVIFCAPEGRETIAQGLDSLGWKTAKAMVYERVPLQPDTGQVACLRESGDLISIWTSISALKIAQQYLPRDVWGKILASPALVISLRIQHHLKQLGAGNVELADGPGNPELLRSVARLKGQLSVG